MKASNDGWLQRIAIFAVVVLSPLYQVPPLKTSLKLAPLKITCEAKAHVSIAFCRPGHIRLCRGRIEAARFMARSPDGRIFVTTMHDLSNSSLRGRFTFLTALTRRAADLLK